LNKYSRIINYFFDLESRLPPFDDDVTFFLSSSFDGERLDADEERDEERDEREPLDDLDEDPDAELDPLLLECDRDRAADPFSLSELLLRLLGIVIKYF
jgi:hypothetical protein